MNDSKHNYRMTVAYDGTHYHGWQIQPNGVSIQEIIESKLNIILREEVRVIGSGRTDAGVHALGQTANFHGSQEVDLYRLNHSLNSLIPDDIRIHSIEKAAPDFHAQYSAKGKIYHYHLTLDPVQSPFKRLYSLHIKEKTDITHIQEAARLFLGTHDFTSFANEAHSGSAKHDPIRTLQRLDVIPTEDGLRLEFEADGFLYKMVRNIVGTLLEVGRGKRKAAEIPYILAAQDRREAGQAAPPHGLFLVRVIY